MGSTQKIFGYATIYHRPPKIIPVELHTKYHVANIILPIGGNRDIVAVSDNNSR